MSHPIRVIVAGVSRAAGNDPTLIAAAELARWTGAELHVVHAFEVPAMFGPPEVGYVSAEWVEQYFARQQETLEAAMQGLTAPPRTVCHAVAGPPGAALLDTASKVGADLLVVGAARAGRLARAFLGTTAQRVLRGAAVPVLVVRRPVHRTLDRLLLTSDLSELSAAVHEEGLDTVASLFGEPRAARSLVVIWVPILPSPLPADAVESAARAELGTFLRARRPRGGVTVEPAVRAGVPAQEIPLEAEAWKADLVVVGTHARGWGARLVLGSVAEASVRDAPCNVLAIPPRALALEHSEEEGTAAEEPAEAAAGVAVPA